MLGFLQVLAPRETIPRAKAAALRAIELDPTIAEPHASLGYMSHMFEWDWRTADRELHEAMRLNPNYPWAPHWYGLLLGPRGSLDESLRYCRTARDLDPLSPIINVGVGIPFQLHGRYEDAVRVYTDVLESDPAFAPAHYYLGQTYEAMEKYDAALRHLERAGEIAGRSGTFMGALGHCYGRSGRRDEARALLTELEERSRERYISAFNIMLIHLGLGDAGKALPWLERSIEERTGLLHMASKDPRLDPLRDHPSFREMIARQGLEAS